MDSNQVIFIRAWDPELPTNINPPLGIGSLISYLREHLAEGYSFKVFDMAVEKDVYQKIERYSELSTPMLFGISSMFPHLYEAGRLAAKLKVRFPQIPIVIGGPAVTTMREEILTNSYYDYAIIGEGERPLAKLLQYLRGGGSISDIKGLISKERGGDLMPDPLSADEIPFPSYEDLGLTRYFDFQGFQWIGRRRYLPLMTARGCPYSCLFCHNIFGRKVREVDIDLLTEKTLTYIKKYKIQDIEIIDDIFNVDEDRAIEIISRIRKVHPEISFLFPNGMRADILSSNFIDFLGRSGTTYISVAVESASERIQRLIRKNLSLKSVSENMERLSRYKIILNGYFMLGFPTETYEEMLQTINYALRSPLHLASFFRLTVFPSTDLFLMLSREKQEIIRGLPDEKFRYNTNRINVSAVSDILFDLLHKYALVRFYFRPLQIIKIAKDHPDGLSLVEGLHHLVKVLCNKKKV